jgi:hypothetical protein
VSPLAGNLNIVSKVVGVTLKTLPAKFAVGVNGPEMVVATKLPSAVIVRLPMGPHPSDEGSNEWITVNTLVSVN